MKEFVVTIREVFRYVVHVAASDADSARERALSSVRHNPQARPVEPASYFMQVTKKENSRRYE